MGDIQIREMEQDGDFALWFSELLAETEDVEASGRRGSLTRLGPHWRSTP
jgi:hypothetical protein